MLKRIQGLRSTGVLGLNARNGNYIMRYNDRSKYPLVDDKIRCKKVLEAVDMPVPALLNSLPNLGATRSLRRRLGDLKQFVIKPANGSGGDGILVITGKRNDMYVGSDGRLLDFEWLEHHVTNVLSGLYSLGGQLDAAMIEDLVKFDPVFDKIAFQGVPDIRVIVFMGYPVMAMVRLPTRSSGGKANLHQGAIGAGIYLDSGRTTEGVQGNNRVSEHPDTGAPISDFQIPHWDTILDMSARCYDAVGLGYLGCDIVLDKEQGPLLLELNARPGLNIQIANNGGLGWRLKEVEKLAEHSDDPEERVAWSRRMFAGPDQDGDTT